MKLSTKGRYGTRALLELALHREERPIILRGIAPIQQILLPYREYLVASLIARIWYGVPEMPEEGFY